MSSFLHRRRLADVAPRDQERCENLQENFAQNRVYFDSTLRNSNKNSGRTVAYEDESTTEDDDDLDVHRVAPRSVTDRYRYRHAQPSSAHSSSETEVEDNQNQDVHQDNSALKAAPRESSDFSDLDGYDKDNELNDGQAVYERFKNRKKEGSKRKRRGSAVAEKQGREAATAKKQRKQPGKYSVDSIVGRKKAGAGGRSNVRWWNEVDQVSSDNEANGAELPDYLEKRKKSQPDLEREELSRLNERSSLVNAGLRLPPAFNDVEFSDEEPLSEKPDFSAIEPSREYEDIPLPVSIGLIPASIAQWLRDYQVEGAAFLHEQFVYQRGCILGDDMGLGKTVQVIAFLTAAYGKTGDQRDAKRMRKIRRRAEDAWYPRTLIICPGTLIQNWKLEFERWGWWDIDIFHGPDKDLALQSAMSGRTEILITTYKTYAMNRDAVNIVDWDCVIADECHQFKETRSDTARAMNQVNALCRIGLTGTAMQNKFEELWTLLNWTNPGHFDSLRNWKRTICEPLRTGQSHDATVAQYSNGRKIARQLVDNLLPPFFKRRMKSLIAHQLPKKSDRVVFCPLTPTQAEAYENFLGSDVIQYIKSSTDPCPCGSRKNQGWCCKTFLPEGRGKWQNQLFSSMLYLQKLSNHLASLIPQASDQQEKQDKDLEFLQVAVPDQWRELVATRGSILHFANPEFCGKWKVLKKLLKWWFANGDKVLVFSHSVRLLRMLEVLFRHTSYNVSYLDGAMSYEERTKVVEDFNSDPQQFVFLISTRAGGVGLNIVSANKVVIVDPNWNPAYDLQAQDRAYRIGQIRDVEVFRLISAGTIEEIVYARQIYKQQQANIAYTASKERRYFKGVQQKKDQKGEIFGLANLFNYQSDAMVLKDIVNKTNVAESKVTESNAGVNIVGVDIPAPDEGHEGGDDTVASKSGAENAAMTQLASLINRGESPDSELHQAKPPVNPIQAILATAGVEYTHDNTEVVGSSRVEEELSRNAEVMAANQSTRQKHVFEGDNINNNTSSPRKRRGAGAPSTGNGNGNDENRKPFRYSYHPPPDVMRRQFCTMARDYRFSSTTEFALYVEGMTQEQRRTLLEKWYGNRKKLVFGALEETR